MRVFIQIPCFNEEQSLPIALAELPRELAGVDSVHWVVIDDGSTDNTVQVAHEHGVDFIVSNTRNQGLAKTFMTGLRKCLDEGADIIVNTDADNQYNAHDIPKLIAPIIDGEAELVIGARPIEQVEQFSKTKKMLQRLGSWVVRQASGTEIADAPSGFRAISRDTARRLNVFNDYTYTLETIIQAGHKGIAIKSVPIGVNPDLRPSRLVKSIPSYIKRSMLTIVRIFAVYRPFRFFGLIAALLLTGGGLIGLRFTIYYLSGDGSGHVQSLILAAVLLISGSFTLLVAFLADLLAANRMLLERIQYQNEKLSERLDSD